MFIWIAFIGTLFVGPCDARKLSPEEQKASDWFQEYGYGKNIMTKPSTRVTTLTRFQYFANISVTGQLDEETISKMEEHRCGVRDPHIVVPEEELRMVPSNLRIHIKPEALRRVRRYNHQGTTWKKTLLTWQLLQLPTNSDLTVDQIRTTMYTAGERWSYYTNINFHETNTGSPDIEVRFASYNHGDPFPFDGPGGTLAHAFYPMNNKGLSGDMHLDNSETFTVHSEKGINLAWVMTHELGHSLGLDHSPVTHAVMYPWYMGYKESGVHLDYDDIVGIQTIYGGRLRTQAPATTQPTDPPTTQPTDPPTEPPTTTTTTTASTTVTTQTTKVTTPAKPVTTSKPLRKCPELPIRSVFELPRIRLGILIAGNGDYMYFFKRTGIKHGPLRVPSYFPRSRLPGPIDAAFTMKSSQHGPVTVLFSGSSYYLFRLFGYKSGPHGFHAGSRSNPLNFAFPSSVRKVDAAMRWHRNEKVYIFAGDYFWKYDDIALKFYPSYPKISQDSWLNTPRKIDAVYSSSAEKRTFFVSGDQLYLLNDMLVEVAQGFPQHIGAAWLNCGSGSRNNYVAPTHAGAAGLPRPYP